MSRGPAFWRLAALAAAVLAGASACKPGAETAAPAVSSAAPARIGGPFSLIDQDGRPADQSILAGKWSAVFFGYTFCPDVCPATLQTLGAAAARMGPAAKDFQVVFVTVDPVRDTPAQLKTYLSSAVFPRGTIGLTGSPAQIAAVAKAYGVFYRKEGTGPDYSVAHSAAIYLMNPQGRFDSALGDGMTPDETRDAVLRAMRRAGAS